MKNAPGVGLRLVALLAAAVQVSCGGGDASAPGMGSAAVVVKNAGDNQSANNGTSVAIPPAVTVQDAQGNAVAGVTVVFAVGPGNGALIGSTQVTNSSGVATVGSWTLGPVGPNTLTATVGSLPAVTFSATSTIRDACSVAIPHTLGSTSSGALTTADCLLDRGAFVDFFSLNVSQAGAYVFKQSSQTSGSSFDSYLYLYGPDGLLVGFNDDDPVAQNLDSQIKALLPSANYMLGASSFDSASTGTYQISSAQASEDITNCETVFVARGVSTNQNLETTDCLFGGFYDDDMYIFLQAGQTVTITMHSTAVDAYLELWNFSGRVATNDDMTPGTTDAQIVYIVPASDFYLIVPSTNVMGAIGAYTLTIQ